MAKFKKSTVSAGVFRVANEDGTRRNEVLTPKRITHWASEIARYLKNGNRLPAPFAHFDPDTKKPIVYGKNGVLTRSDLNGGFWDSPRVENDPVFGPTLVLELDADGDESNVNTAAGKIGKTVKETSVYVVPEFEDGHGNKYTDFPAHIALVTHPIQPGQSNFELVPGTLAMSQLLFMAVPPKVKAKTGSGNDPYKPGKPKSTEPPKADDDFTEEGDDDFPGTEPLNADNASVDTVLPLLRRCGIALPDDTTPQNFLSYLTVALGQKSLGDGDDEGDVYEPPEGAQTKSPAPVAMSAAPITAETFASIPKEVFMSHPAAKALEETNAVLLSALTEQARATRRARIDAFVASHPEMAEYAKATLYPMLDTFQMSLTANAPAQPLDTLLTGLEAIPATVAKQSPQQALLQHTLGMAMANGQLPPNPYMMGNVDPNYKAEDVVARFFSNTGGKP